MSTKSELVVTLPEAGDVAGWSALKARLVAKLQRAETRVAELKTERKSLALLVMSGDESATKRAVALDSEIRRLRRDVDEWLPGAIETADAGFQRAREIRQQQRDLERAELLDRLATEHQKRLQAVDDSGRAVAAAIGALLEHVDKLRSEGVATRQDRLVFRLRSAMTTYLIEMMEEKQLKPWFGVLLGDDGLVARAHGLHRYPLIGGPDLFELSELSALSNLLRGTEKQPLEAA